MSSLSNFLKLKLFKNVRSIQLVVRAVIYLAEKDNRLDSISYFLTNLGMLGGILPMELSPV